MNTLSKDPIVVLGSQSPRRKEILDLLGVHVDRIQPSNFDEESIPYNGVPVTFVPQIAIGKIEALRHQIEAELQDTACIIGGDLLTFLDNTPYAKPSNRDEARKLVQMFMNRSHQEVGTCVVWTKKHGLLHQTTTSEVFLPTLEGNILEHYLDICDPTDKSGGISVQHWNSLAKETGGQVEVRSGNLSTVIGLNAESVAELLDQVGVIYENSSAHVEQKLTERYLS